MAVAPGLWFLLGILQARTADLASYAKACRNAIGAAQRARRVPGDKSISHRALMLGALAIGETRITGLLEAEDVLATASAMRALGAGVERRAAATWLVRGAASADCSSRHEPLDFGNSGTGVRLMMGVVAGHRHRRRASPAMRRCRRRPMGRVLKPLRADGRSSVAEARQGDAAADADAARRPRCRSPMRCRCRRRR